MVDNSSNKTAAFQTRGSAFNTPGTSFQIINESAFKQAQNIAAE